MEINAKQAGTILIAFIFIGSTIGFALNWATPGEKKEKTPENLFTRPLSNSERRYFINNDQTVLTLFYIPNDIDSSNMKEMIENFAKDLDKKLIVEEVNVNTFQSFSFEYNIMSVPTIIIRGKNNQEKPIRIEGTVEYKILKDDICSTYETKPASC